ncbi:MAG TPA: ABC transporter ATP-binding protein [Rhodocyclaceae bacterium]|nr:ABC transporter ATP-binding protein [Rhodocyclaceae bacterium]
MTNGENGGSRAPAILFENVRFRWPKAAEPCLDVPAFRVDAGERVFIHGPSGSGKSTLLSLVGGVIEPERGRIEVLGQALRQMRAGARDRFRAANVGFIFQLFNLVPYLSALDNILLPCRFSGERAARVGSSAREEALRLAHKLDLDATLLNRSAAELSVGQQQRVAAARALIGRPGLVIADEPTSALDADRQQAFLDLLLAECALTRACLLFVSHDERLSERFDRVVSLPEINHASTSAPAR